MLRYLEDIFITKLYSSGVLRYAENNSDMDFGVKFKMTAKGPNSLGNADQRRIPTRQRILHPSMCGYISIDDTSNSDPGRTGSLSPYSDMKSMYFDESLYENEMHFRIAQYLNELEADPEGEELRIVCDTEEQYNEILDKLYRAKSDKVRIFSVSNNPMEIIVEKDPRLKYRKFDEGSLMEEPSSE